MPQASLDLSLSGAALGHDPGDPLAATEALFFAEGGLPQAETRRILDQSLGGLEDGELFLEFRAAEALTFDDGRLKTASSDLGRGFGLRGVLEDRFALAHATDLSLPALQDAAAMVSAVRSGASGSGSAGASAPPASQRRLYAGLDPIQALPFAEKVRLVEAIDAAARAADPRIVQVSVSIVSAWQAVRIERPGGQAAADLRPLVRLNVSVIARDAAGRQESGSHGVGGRAGLQPFVQDEAWRPVVAEAVRQALVNLDSRPAPAGQMPVVLGPGWPGVMLHEAVGHGLEGDFNRKGTSAFAGLMGSQVAARGVTVVDDGTLLNRRGSLSIDDEGTPSSRTVLIEDGRLVGFMQDRLNARLMGVAPTGNGRRQSFAHPTLPRMTNTYMLAGSHAPEEIIRSVDRGVYAVNFGGGQVDITSGKFVFSMSEAYLIEGGKVTAPLKGATLIGNGADALTRISMIGNDLALDTGIGTCGKEGQSVPVGVGQPTLRMEGLTIGGTA